MVGALSLLLTLVALLAAGCAQQPARAPQGEASSLQRWVDSELGPYLVSHLGEHPRFRGESILLVRLDGQDIQPEIDGLTRRLRDQLMDRLLAEAGVRMPWLPERQPPQHHRGLEQASCTRVRDAAYYVGIEITGIDASEHRVSVRALDVRAGEWVGGFGSSWSGRLTASESHALQERRSDESLRGLRVLPFGSGHPDLAAHYLANNLSCLLRQGEEAELRVYVEALESDRPELHTLLDLIGNNLSRYRAAQVTDVKREATLLLRGEAHEVEPGLYQVWVVLHPQDSGTHLEGMDTATYVRMQPAATVQRTRPAGAPPRAARPAIAALELVRRDAARDSAGCRTARPGAAGLRAAQGCPVVELSVEGAEQVFVFVHAMRDGASRLSAGTCSQAPGDGLSGADRHSYLFPAARFGGSDWPTVYAIAVSGRQLAQRFTSLLKGLPDACSEASGLHAGGGGLDAWLDELDRLIAANGEHTVWTARRIP